MGEIANDMISGLACSDCGIYFEEEHGYPVLCDDCHKTWPADDIKMSGLERANIPEVV